MWTRVPFPHMLQKKKIHKKNQTQNMIHTIQHIFKILRW
jgi:hypothetical protein